MVKVVTLADVKRDRQNALYEKLITVVARYRELGKQADALVADLRYRQAAEILKADAIVEMVTELVYEGKSVVVFVNFRETLAYLAKALNTRSLIYGGQSADARETVIRDFQANTSRVILSMIEAGGQSISLHDLHGGHQRVSLICPTYNPVSLQQVLGRTRRAGSRSVPVMMLVYAEGTVEVKVADAVQKKISNIKALNEGDLVEEELFDLGLHGTHGPGISPGKDAV
jgi:superfamily II DNA or RNA helicase